MILDYDMPRNLFSPTCVHTLYDSGCGVIRGTYSANGTAGAGLDVEHDQFSRLRWRSTRKASLVWTSGANANVRATVKSVGVGVGFNLMYPLPFAPIAGDAFTVYAGCDHTQATCQGRFNNLAELPRLPLRPTA